MLDTNNEIWKDVPGYEGYYQVSNLGNVKSLMRPGAWRERILIPCEYKEKGYLYVNLNKPGSKPKKHKIHRLVAKAFLENSFNYPEVNHKDGDKKNNTVSNLEWCTGIYNKRHLVYSLGISRIPAVPVRITFENGETKQFRSVREAERETGIDSRRISKTLNNQIKKSYGFKVERA